MGATVLASMGISYLAGFVIGVMLGVKIMYRKPPTKVKSCGLKWDSRAGDQTTETNTGTEGVICGQSQAPLGWYCSRSKGHDGPCAAYQSPDRAICPTHKMRMALSFYDRPGSAQGNGWFCMECAADHAAARNAQAR